MRSSALTIIATIRPTLSLKSTSSLGVGTSVGMGVKDEDWWESGACVVDRLSPPKVEKGVPESNF